MWSWSTSGWCSPSSCPSWRCWPRQGTTCWEVIKISNSAASSHIARFNNLCATDGQTWTSVEVKRVIWELVIAHLPKLWWWLLFRRKLRLMGMKVTSTLVLPIGYILFVIIWSISVNSIHKSPPFLLLIIIDPGLSVDSLRQWIEWGVPTASAQPQSDCQALTNFIL